MNTVEVRLYATLRKYHSSPGNSQAMVVELGDKAQLENLLDKLNIPREEVTVVLVNGRREEASYLLQDGDRVGIFPLVGGG